MGSGAETTSFGIPIPQGPPSPLFRMLTTLRSRAALFSALNYPASTTPTPNLYFFPVIPQSCYLGMSYIVPQTFSLLRKTQYPAKIYGFSYFHAKSPALAKQHIPSLPPISWFTQHLQTLQWFYHLYFTFRPTTL